MGSGVVLLVDDAVGVTYNDGQNLLSDDEIFGLQSSISTYPSVSSELYSAHRDVLTLPLLFLKAKQFQKMGKLVICSCGIVSFSTYSTILLVVRRGGSWEKC